MLTRNSVWEKPGPNLTIIQCVMSATIIPMMGAEERELILELGVEIKKNRAEITLELNFEGRTGAHQAARRGRESWA